jgi:hypothetical protein
MNEIHAGTEIINAATGRYMCSRTNRWTIYAMTKDEQDSTDKRKWYLDGTILKNIADNNGVHWEEDGGRVVMREKTSDSSCDKVVIVPYDLGMILVKTTSDLRWLAQNLTNLPTKTSVSKETTEEITREVVRGNFGSISSNTKLTTSATGTHPLLPSIASSVAFSTELATMSSWNNQETQIEKKTVKVEHLQFELAPMTGKAFKRVTWTYTFSGLLLMVEQHASEVTYAIDKDGNPVE